MTTICIADKNRLTVRGVQNGRRYLVKKEGRGWRIEPAPITERRVRKVAEIKRDLTDHLDAMAAEGLSLEPVKPEKIPSCRF